ncbi:MAG: protein kinase, partial [Planctomycetota bacterium]|nr:protein kinase [Planctomycetota bacterium]
MHEHSARILDVGEDADGVVFIAQELVEGVTLDEWIHFGDGISPSVAVDVLHQISCALHAMHSVGLVHCDLSPHNIMVQLREGQPFVKVLDFGIAKAGPSTGGEGRSRLAPQGDGGIDSESGLRGWANPPYSAPEHLEGKDVDVRADIYSLGVIGYEILTRTFPVEGESGRQLAKATIEGRIQPLRATIEIPPRLSHLINGMLAMSPADRPTDASEIVQELESIRRPQLQLLSLMSVVMLTISAFAFVLVHLLAEEPLLRMQPCLLHWAESPESDQKIVELRSEDLVDLRFDYDGFDAGDFEVVAHHGSGGARTKAEGLVPMVTADGELTLSGDSPAYRGFLVAMAGLQDAVTLAFGVQGRPPIGYSQVLVDDEPPVIGFRRSDLVDRTLTAAESLILNIEDKGSIKTVQMVARYDEDGNSKDDSVELPPRKGQTVYRARDLLASIFPGVSARSEVVLVVRVSDAAGNVSSKSISLPGVDLEVPGIRNVEGRRAAGIVLCGPKGARLKILLDRFESGLSLLVTQPRGGRQEIPLSAMGTEQLFVMEPFTSDARLPAEDGSYRFQIRDAAGNLSAVLDRKLRFRSASAESILRGGADQAAESEVVELDDGIVVSGTPAQLAFTCNEVYRPSHARVISAAGIPMESGARLVDASDGQGTIILEGLADGAYLLEITTEDRSAAIGPTESYPVRVLAGSVRLRLPVPPGSRFLRELIGSGLLVEAEGGVQQGARWSCVPDDFRLIQGKCWFGSPRNLVPSELQPARDGDGRSLIGTLSLLQGENVLALELKDVFGRPIDILVGQEQAPTEDVDGGDSVSRVAQFFFHDQPLQPPADVRVEFGQASKIPLDIKLPLRPGDGVKLQIGSLLRKADSVIPSSDGARVEFRVPFEVLMSSILPETPTRESFAKLSLPKADCVLDTPGGRFDVTLQFQVTLSNLPRVHARGFLDPGRVVPDVLAEMAMVPVL